MKSSQSLTVTDKQTLTELLDQVHVLIGKFRDIQRSNEELHSEIRRIYQENKELRDQIQQLEAERDAVRVQVTEILNEISQLDIDDEDS